MTGYLRTCLACGGPLVPVALGPETAPWLCSACCHGWFVCELAGVGRASFRVSHRDWGHAAGRELAKVRDIELAEARQRGTSALPEHLALLDVAQLGMLVKRKRLSGEFRKLVEAEQARRVAA